MSNYQQEFDKSLPDFLAPKAKARNCTNCRHYDHSGHNKGRYYCNEGQELLPKHPLDHCCESFEELTCAEECRFCDSIAGTCFHDGKSHVGCTCPFDIHIIMAM